MTLCRIGKDFLTIWARKQERLMGGDAGHPPFTILLISRLIVIGIIVWIHVRYVRSTVYPIVVKEAICL